MTEQLYRLAYYSRNALPDDADMGVELQRILDASRKNNARANVTGALLFNRGCFGQILEGTCDDVERVFETVQNDPRHTSVVALQFEAVPERGFGPWAMAHVGAAAFDGAGYDAMSKAIDVNPASCAGTDLFDALRGVMLAHGPTRSKTWSGRRAE